MYILAQEPKVGLNPYIFASQPTLCSVSPCDQQLPLKVLYSLSALRRGGGALCNATVCSDQTGSRSFESIIPAHVLDIVSLHRCPHGLACGQSSLTAVLTSE